MPVSGQFPFVARPLGDSSLSSVTVMLRRSALGLLLLALVAALPTHGWAMGAMARVTQVVVLCSGTGPHTALIDWRGERVDPVPGCPDCTPAFGVAVLDPPVTAAAPPGHADLWAWPSIEARPHTTAPGLTWPRAPPV